MRITGLDIHNFRGIKNGSFWMPVDMRFLCIIGPGDTCKSTLLKAMRLISDSIKEVLIASIIR